MKKLKALLVAQKVDFEMLQHGGVIRTAEEGARYFGIEVGQTAPTIILKSEQGYYAMVICGDYGRIAFDEIEGMLGCHELKLAKPQEVQQVTGFKVGNVPLVGHHLPTIMDKQLLRYAYIYGGTGDPHHTLKINPAHLEKVNEVVAYVRE